MIIAIGERLHGDEYQEHQRHDKMHRMQRSDDRHERTRAHLHIGGLLLANQPRQRISLRRHEQCSCRQTNQQRAAKWLLPLALHMTSCP